MIVGQSPFYEKSKDKVFQNVLERKLKFSKDFDKNARDLIDKLLDPIPECRLGMRNTQAEGYIEIKEHPFFAGVDFDALTSRTAKVPFSSLNPMSTSLITDSDENSSKKDDSVVNVVKKPTDDINRYFDQCCVYRARFLSRKYWEGEVKVYRKIFLKKPRYMILFEDGTLLLLRRGHIRTEYLIDDTAEITLMKNNKLKLKGSGKSAEIVETPDAEAWISILKSVQMLNSPMNKKQRF